MWMTVWSLRPMGGAPIVPPAGLGGVQGASIGGVDGRRGGRPHVRDRRDPLSVAEGRRGRGAERGVENLC